MINRDSDAQITTWPIVGLILGRSPKGLQSLHTPFLAHGQWYFFSTNIQIKSIYIETKSYIFFSEHYIVNVPLQNSLILSLGLPLTCRGSKIWRYAHIGLGYRLFDSC